MVALRRLPSAARAGFTLPEPQVARLQVDRLLESSKHRTAVAHRKRDRTLGTAAFFHP